MTKALTVLLLLMLGQNVNGQKIPLKSITEKLKKGQNITATDFGFKEYAIVQKGDTTNFYTYQKLNAIPTSIFMYLPGSSAEDIYSYHKENDSSYWFNSLTTFDFSYLPENYLFVIVAKPGFGFIGNGDKKAIPQKYWEKTSLQDRVTRANTTLNYIQKKLLKKPEKTAVFGYSEGFYVGAKLATINRSVSHLGVGGGGGLSDFYDFIIANQKDFHKGQATIDTTIQYNQDLITSLSEIMTEETSSKIVMGYSKKRWASFSEPAIQNLVRLKIPIYQVHGSDDESTAIESAYIVPVEFARLKKTNLTFRVYPNCNHSLTEKSIDGKEINHWDEMMRDFFKWIENHKKYR